MWKQFGRDVLIYGGADFVFKLVSFAIIPVYTHLLDVPAFGAMALLTVSASLLGSLANLGINNALHRFYFDASVNENTRGSIVSTGLVQLVIALVVVVGLALLTLLSMRHELLGVYGLQWPWVVLVLVNVIPDQIAQYALDTARIQFAPWRFFSIAVIKNVAGVLLGLFLLVGMSLGLTGIFLGSLIAASLAVPVSLWLIRRDLTRSLDFKVGRAMFNYGYPFVFASAAYWIFGSMDRWMLARLSNPTEVGIFSVGLRFAALLTFVIAAFGQAWAPFSMRMMRENSDYRQNYSQVLTTWFFFLAWVGLGVALFSPELMTMINPPPYWPAAPVLAIGAAGLVLYGTTQVTALGISISKRTGVLTAGAWAAAVANVGVNLIAIPRYGAVGAASATLLSYGVLTIWFCWWSQRLHPIPLQFGKLSCGLVLVALAALSPIFVPLAPISLPTVGAKLALLLAALVFGQFCGIIDWRRAVDLVMTRAKVASAGPAG